jgi:hypothetical protein
MFKFKLADVTSPLLGATEAPFSLATGFQNATYFISSALPGIYTLGFGVMDIGDNTVGALLLSGMLGIGLWRSEWQGHNRRLKKSN